MAGTELTLGQSTSNASEWDMFDVKMFMKNVGTDGLVRNPASRISVILSQASMIIFERRVNPVEGMYKAFPFFLFINATYGGWLLDPVFEFASSDQWTFPYAPRDLGQCIRILHDPTLICAYNRTELSQRNWKYQSSRSRS